MTETNDTNDTTLHERRRDTVQRCLQSLMKRDPQFFYQPTSTIARGIHALMRRPDMLDDDKRDIVKSLKVRDIELLLAFR